jgi:TonB family protein
MPTTEVPTSPASRPPEPPLFRRKRARYEELEPEELLHLIDRLEDERSLARRREGIWISVIAHLIIFWFLFYGPKVLWHQPHIVNPPENRKDMTYLALPPDQLQNVKPRPNAPLSDKNRIAQPARPPVLDRRTLERLREMQRAQGPPAPVPPQPQAAPQQQAQAAPPQPQRTPPPSSPVQPPPQQQPVLEEPKPAPTKPNFSSSESPGDEIRQAMREAGRERGQSSGDYGTGAPSPRQPMNEGVQILSDTLGVDFDPYMRRVIADTYRAWLPIIPESARPPLDKQGIVGIRFKIYPDGSVKDMSLEYPSHDVPLDRAAWAGITGAAPYPSLPKEFKGPYLELRFAFYYNIDPSQSR